jgi:hypothetical protein
MQAGISDLELRLAHRKPNPALRLYNPATREGLHREIGMFVRPSPVKRRYRNVAHGISHCPRGAIWFTVSIKWRIASSIAPDFGKPKIRRPHSSLGPSKSNFTAVGCDVDFLPRRGTKTRADEVRNSPAAEI